MTRPPASSQPSVRYDQEKGKIGDSYNVGSSNEIPNIDMVKMICLEVDRQLSKKNSFKLVQFVKDRLGHDFRYSIDASKIVRDLKWSPKTALKKGIKKTVSWYIENVKIKK